MKDTTSSRKELLQEIESLREENRRLKAENSAFSKKDSEDRLFRKLFDADPAAVVIRDAQLNPVYANPAFLNVSGFTTEEFHNTSFQQLVPDKTRKVSHDEILPLLKAGHTWEGALETRNKSGDVLFLKSTICPIMDDNGLPAHFGVRMTPLTEGAGLKRALALSGELTRAVFSGSPVGIGVTGSDARFLTANKALCDILGYSEKELAELSITDLTHPDDWAREKEIRESLAPNTDQHYTMEKRVITKKGDPIWIKLTSSVMKDKDGHIRYAVGICEDITIAKFMREALLDSEKRFWEILSRSQNIVYRFNAVRNRYDYISSYVSQVSRHSLNEMMNLGWENLSLELHPDDLRVLESTIEKATSERRNEKTKDIFLQYRRRGPDGEYLWFNDYPTLIFNDRGEVDAYVGVSYNVTEQKLAEKKLELAHRELECRVRDRTKELRQNEELLKTLIDNLPFDFWAMDADGRYSMQNAFSRANWGDVVGRRLDELGLDEETLRIWEEEGNRARNGETLRSEYKVPGKKTPRYFESIIAPIRPDGRPAGILGVTMDITDRKQAEQALAKSETTFRNLAENSLQGITLSKGNPPKIVFANSAICRIMGYSKEEFLNMTSGQVKKLIHPEDRGVFFSRYARRINNENAPEQYEFRAVRRDGAVIWLEVFSTVTEYEGEPSIQAAYVDITERKKAQERVMALTGEVLKGQEEERNALARDLHDNVAQDLSTLKIGCSTLMSDLAGTPNFDHDRFTSLSNTLERTIATVRGMAYELRPPGLEILKPAKLLEQVCDEFSSSTGIRTNYSAAGMNGVFLSQDRTLNLYRILQEALSNIKNHSQALRAKVRVVASHPEIILRIEDDGRGFDIGPRTIEALEEKRMGLWGIRERVRLMDGTFSIKSQPDKGVRIVVEIPYEEAAK